MFKNLFRIMGLTRRRSNYRWRKARPFSTPQHTNCSPAGKIKAQSHIQIDNLSKAWVKWVIDGDTVAVVLGSHEMTIRLDSIDSPEDGQPWGDNAKYALIKIIGRQNVRLEVHGIDPYGRTLATLYVWHKQKNEWTNVNERMIMLGHAWVMRMFYDHLPEDRQDKLNSLERWARSKKMGLWKAPNPVPPWEWRHKE
jgi:endonuclease YncB( thermonuclease family)